MKKLILIFLAIAVILTGAIACDNNQTNGGGEASVEGTYKLYSMAGHNLGETYFGMTLTEDTSVITLGKGGTFTSLAKKTSGTIETSSGTWAKNEDNKYTATITTVDGNTLGSPQNYSFTIEGNVLTLDDGGYIIIMHKA